MKSMCQEARRNSPSVADCRPTSRCIATTSRIASSSTPRSSSLGMRPAAWSSRAWSSRRGRSRLPTWSARNGGVVRPMEPPPTTATAGVTSTSGTTPRQPDRRPAGLPGMPPVLDPDDVYAATRPGQLSEVARRFPARVYVPNSASNTVDVIDARTFKRVRRFPVGRQPQHVTPSWDLRTLWVGNNLGNSLTAIDPATGRRGRTVKVADPYNLYFTPDGRRAIVVAEALRRLDFRDPRTMRRRHSLRVPCRGVDHMDFSADGRRLLASCEFSGHLVHVDVARERVVGVLRLNPGAMPQDV